MSIKMIRRGRLLRIAVLLAAVAFLLSFISCKSTKEIDSTLTASQLIQHGQNSEDMGFWRSAEVYYTTALERYGTDGSVYVEGKYALGHLHIKTRKWERAYVELREIVQMYEGSFIGQSPVTPTFYKLAKMELEKIPEKSLPVIEAHLIKEAQVREEKERREAEKEERKASEDNIEKEDEGESAGVESSSEAASEDEGGYTESGYAEESGEESRDTQTPGGESGEE